MASGKRRKPLRRGQNEISIRVLAYLHSGFFYPAPGPVGERRPTEAELRALWRDRRAEIVEAWKVHQWKESDAWVIRAFDQGDAAALSRMAWRRRPGTDY